MDGIYQVYVKLLNGKNRALNFTSSPISVLSIKIRICEITGVPIHDQRLVTGTKQLEDYSVLRPSDGIRCFPALHLLLRLRGGKGGFGSLLRGAATKAGQKKTNNFDACRDMSGRRLRHVNAEKKLEEWREEAEERRLEKVAEDFIKKKAKAAVKKGGGSGDAEKYVEKYREDSTKCMEEVEKSVREAIGSYVNSKRKIAVSGASESDVKRFKIWMGKRKLGDSETDDSDDDADEQNENSVVLDNGSHSDSSKAVYGSSGSVTGGKLDGKSSSGSSYGSASEEEETSVRGSSLPGESNDVGESALDSFGERIVQNGGESFSEEPVVSGIEVCMPEKLESNETENGNRKGNVGRPQSISSSEDGDAFGCRTIDAEVSLDSESKPIVPEKTVVISTNVSDVVKPLNFEEFDSAAELE
ncbi:hypothetical protein U1Q18_046491, partial [Sarracenia purpurea var. burkii]